MLRSIAACITLLWVISAPALAQQVNLNGAVAALQSRLHATPEPPFTDAQDAQLVAELRQGFQDYDAAHPVGSAALGQRLGDTLRERLLLLDRAALLALRSQNAAQPAQVRATGADLFRDLAWDGLIRIDQALDNLGQRLTATRPPGQTAAADQAVIDTIRAGLESYLGSSDFKRISSPAWRDRLQRKIEAGFLTMPEQRLSLYRADAVNNPVGLQAGIRLDFNDLAYRNVMDIAPAMAALEARLRATDPTGAETATDVEILGAMRSALEVYLGQGAYPDITDKRLRTTLIDNFAFRMMALSDADLAALRTAHRADARDTRARAVTMLEAVSYFTVMATPLTNPNANGLASHAWRRESHRQPGGRGASHLNSGHWATVEGNYATFKTFVQQFYQQPWTTHLFHDFEGVLQSVPPAGADRPQTLAGLSRDVQVQLLTHRLRVAVEAQALNVADLPRQGLNVPGVMAPKLPQVYSDAQLRDMAEMHYVMIGWTQNAAGQPTLAGLAALERLESDIADRAVSGRPTDLETVLSDLEHDFGFRSEHPLPTGFLPGDVFAATVAGGYTMTDHGAGLYHGALTHRLQLRAILEDYRANPGRYSQPPILTYSNIGALDIVNNTQLSGTSGRFRFEPREVTDLWFQMFDQFVVSNSGLPDLAHPDGIRDLIRATGRMPLIAAELDTTFKRRLREGQQLRQIWDRSVNDDADLTLTGVPFSGELAFLNDNAAFQAARREVIDDRARVNRNLARNDPRYTAQRGLEDRNDKVWQIVRLHQLENSPGFTRAQYDRDGTGPQEIDLLMPAAAPFNPGVSPGVLAAQTRRHVALQRVAALRLLPSAAPAPDIPPLAGVQPDAPLPAGHEAVSPAAQADAIGSSADDDDVLALLEQFPSPPALTAAALATLDPAHDAAGAILSDGTDSDDGEYELGDLSDTDSEGSYESGDFDFEASEAAVAALGGGLRTGDLDAVAPDDADALASEEAQAFLAGHQSFAVEPGDTVFPNAVLDEDAFPPVPVDALDHLDDLPDVPLDDLSFPEVPLADPLDSLGEADLPPLPESMTQISLDDFPQSHSAAITDEEQLQQDIDRLRLEELRSEAEAEARRAEQEAESLPGAAENAPAQAEAVGESGPAVLFEAP